MPIYEAMFKDGIVKQRMFNICLGKDGGFMQVGGYDRDLLLEDVKWFRWNNANGGTYKFDLHGVSLNNHLIDGSNS